MTSHQAVNLPIDLLDYLDILRRHSKIKRKYAFSSKAEVVRRALSDFIDKLEKDIERDINQFIEKYED